MDTDKFKRVLKAKPLTEEELKADEDELDEYSLKTQIKIKGVLIKTYGVLRPYIKSTTIARKFEDFLHEDDFHYFYNWILLKEIKQKKI
jgi:hypothetical protein